MGIPSYNNPYTEPEWQCRLHGEIVAEGYLDADQRPVMLWVHGHEWAQEMTRDETRQLGLQLIGLADWYQHHYNYHYQGGKV